MSKPHEGDFGNASVGSQNLINFGSPTYDAAQEAIEDTTIINSSLAPLAIEKGPGLLSPNSLEKDTNPLTLSAKDKAKEKKDKILLGINATPDSTTKRLRQSRKSVSETHASFSSVSSTGFCSPCHSQQRVGSVSFTSPPKSPSHSQTTPMHVVPFGQLKSPECKATTGGTTFPNLPESQQNLDASFEAPTLHYPTNIALESTSLYVQQALSPARPRGNSTSGMSGELNTDKESVPASGSAGTSSSSSPRGGARGLYTPSTTAAISSPKLLNNVLTKVPLSYQMVEESEEFGRFMAAIQAIESGAGDEGACNCDYALITKDTRGFDYSQYDYHHSYHSCAECGRRPSIFLCLHCFQSFCPSHVRGHFLKACPNAVLSTNAQEKQNACLLFINNLDLLTSFDRIFWCELCQRFTWKFTDEYEPLTDQLAVTKGTYLDDPVTDVWMRQYDVKYISTVSKKRIENENVATDEGLITFSFGAPDQQAGNENSNDAANLDEEEEETEPQFMVEQWDERLGSPGRKKKFGSFKATSQAEAKKTETLEREVRAIGASMQGWRAGQEDAECTFTMTLPCAPGTLDCSCSVFCVFDGHGGDAVAKRCAQELKRFVYDAFLEAPPLSHAPAEPSTSGNPTTTNHTTESKDEDNVFKAGSHDASTLALYFTTIFQHAFINLDTFIMNSPEGLRGDYNCVGATACLVALTEDFIVCANIGDSGAILLHPAEVKRRRLSHQVLQSAEASQNASPTLSSQSSSPRQTLSPHHSAPHLSKGEESVKVVEEKMSQSGTAYYGSPSASPASGNIFLGGGGKHPTPMVPLPGFLSANQSACSLNAHSPTATNCIAVVPLSKPHRLSDEKEAKRVKEAGYTVSNDRIEGMLAVPRALGDYDFKQCGGKELKDQAVSSLPDVTVIPRKRQSKFAGELMEERDWCIALACDGIWDTLRRDDVCKLLYHELYVVPAHKNSSTQTSPTQLPRSRTSSQPPLQMDEPCKSGSGNFDSKGLAATVSSASGLQMFTVPPVACQAPRELDQHMVNALNVVFERALAGAINDEGLGLDNMSLMLIRPVKNANENSP